MIVSRWALRMELLLLTCDLSPQSVSKMMPSEKTRRRHAFHKENRSFRSCGRNPVKLSALYIGLPPFPGLSWRYVSCLALIQRPRLRRDLQLCCHDFQQRRVRGLALRDHPAGMTEVRHLHGAAQAIVIAAVLSNIREMRRAGCARWG